MNGWTSFNPNAGRVTMSPKLAALSPIPKVREKKFVIQQTDLKSAWRDVTPEMAEGLAEDILAEMRKTNRNLMFRIQEVK